MSVFDRMSFEDYLMNFDFLWVCHLEPDAVAEQISRAKVCVTTALLLVASRHSVLHTTAQNWLN